MEARFWNREGGRTGKAKGSHPLSAAIWAGLGCLSWCMWFNTFNLGSLFVQRDGFCFHSLVACPVDHIDHGGTQTRHEAFWTHSCVFHGTDSGKHMLNSHRSPKSVWLLLSLFLFLGHPLRCFSPLSDNWLVKTQHPVVTWGMYWIKALQTSGFCFSSSSGFSAYLWFYLYILLSLLIPLAVTSASRTNEGDRALHILPWTPGQVPQQRAQFLWAACVHCWSDILH